MEKLGIEAGMLLTQIVNFLIMVFILTKFLYRPLLKMIDERKKKIEEGLEFSKLMKEKQLELEAQKDKILEKAREEGQKIIEEYRQQGKKVESKVVNEANDEVRQIKEKAKQDITIDRAKMEEELNKQVTQIALAISQAALRDFFADRKIQIQVVEKKIKELAEEKFNG